MIISPIFYMGNKKKLIKKGLTEMFPKNINTFFDLFAGSCIVSMNSNANSYVINDINPRLIQLYNMFKNFTSSHIIEKIEKNIENFGLPKERTKRNVYNNLSKLEEYKEAYNNLRHKYNSDKDVFDFYTLMFYSFSQQFRFSKNGNFNMPFGNDCFSEKNKEYIVEAESFFKYDKLQIFNTQYYNLIDMIKKDDFVYIDPPYLNTVAVYNEHNGWSYEDEEKLLLFCEEINRRGIKFAMSNVVVSKNIVNTSLISWCEKMKFHVYEFKNFGYTTCGNINSVKEVLICNYEVGNV